MTWIYCLLIAVSAYVIFIAAPALVAYRSVFCRKTGVPFVDRDLKNSCLAPYEKRIAADFDFFRRHEKESVSICADDGVKLVGSYYSEGNRRLAICIHGYNSTPLNCFASLGRFLLSAGYDVLMPDQRAHGESGGKHSTLGLTEQYDVLSWIGWADGLAEVEEVILVGVSMGCASVAYASDKIRSPKVKGMILDCGFASPYEQIKTDCQARHVPYPLILPLIRDHAKRRLKIDISQQVGTSLEHTAIPALFMHGGKDTTVDLRVTEEHYRRCSSKKEFYFAENGFHANAFMTGGKEAEAAVSSFLASI